MSSKVLLYAQSHRHDIVYHGLCYTSRGKLAVMRNSSMGPPQGIDPTIPIIIIIIIIIIINIETRSDRNL